MSIEQNTENAKKKKKNRNRKLWLPILLWFIIPVIFLKFETGFHVSQAGLKLSVYLRVIFDPSASTSHVLGPALAWIVLGLNSELHAC